MADKPGASSMCSGRRLSRRTPHLANVGADGQDHRPAVDSAKVAGVSLHMFLRRAKPSELQDRALLRFCWWTDRELEVDCIARPTRACAAALRTPGTIDHPNW